MRRVIALEICVEEPSGVAAAISGGADRLELCAALELGGLTPSAALIEAALRIARPAGVGIYAMVRPRAGDFAYDGATLALAMAQGEALLAAGCDGLVFGACAEGVLDDAALRCWVDRFAGRFTDGGREVELTLHRAIDLVPDGPAAVERAVDLGFDRILSSGGAVLAMDGAARLTEMVAAAAGRCRIAAGSGIRADNVAALLRCTGVHEVHASASMPGHAPDPPLVEFGFATGPRRRTSRAEVAALRAAIDLAGISAATGPRPTVSILPEEQS